jgi:hypothetical protein
VGLLRVEKDPFRDSGLPRIDVGHEPNISGSGEPFLSSHLFFSIFEQKYILAILKGFLRKVNPSTRRNAEVYSALSNIEGPSGALHLALNGERSAEPSARAQAEGSRRSPGPTEWEKLEKSP